MSEKNNSSEELVQTCLWEHPRPLMTEVIPTLLRRIKTNWGLLLNDERHADHFMRNSPLPEFIPGTLFGERICRSISQLPDNKKHAEEEKESSEARSDIDMNDEDETNKFLPILKAMKTFAPGRVSRRFGINRSNEGHWVAPEVIDPNLIEESIDVDKSYKVILRVIGNLKI